MKKYIIIACIYLLTFSLMAEIEIKKISNNEIIFTYKLDNLQINSDENYTSISIEDHISSDIAGSPDLPFKEILIAVPPQGTIEITKIKEITEQRIIQYPVKPVPNIIKSGKTHDFIYEIDQQKYLYQNEKKLIKVGEKGNIRFNYYFPLKLNPIHYDYVDNTLQITKEMDIRIKIKGETQFYNSITDEFNTTLNDLFLNYTQAMKWQFQDKIRKPHIPLEKSEFWYRIELNTSENNFINFKQLDILPKFADHDQLRMLAMQKNSENDDYSLNEIPLFVDKTVEKIYFSFNKNIPKTVWLTFGGTFTENPLRLNNYENKSIAENIKSLFEYTKPNNFARDEQIDCLFIAPTVFMEQANELAEFHRDFDGFSCKVTDQMYIITQYGDGSANPHVIELYIQDLFNNLPTPALQYVILCGSGTKIDDTSISLSNWYAQTEKNKILVNSTNDDEFVIFSGSYPSLSIGRIPAKMSSDFGKHIERIKEYAQNPNLGWWQNKVLILADDELKGNYYEGIGSAPYSTDGMNHSKRAVQMTELLESINPTLYIENIFGFNYELDEFKAKPGATADLIEKINSGVLIWHYIGHGNHDVLGDEEFFRGTKHSQYLQNHDKLNLFIAASCSVGEFHRADVDCIAEKLLFLENGGSIITVAASEGCGPIQNTTLMNAFIPRILHDQQRAGEALYKAKRQVSASSHSKLYNLFGDPLLFIKTPTLTGEMNIIEPSNSEILYARQTVTVNADLSLNNTINTQGELRVYDSSTEKVYVNYNYPGTDNDTIFYFTVRYPQNGVSYFHGSMDIINDDYNFSFVVPDDIHNGEKGRIINYIADEINKKAYLNAFYPINYSNTAIDTFSIDSPEITIWLDSETFQAGDLVSTDPKLIANISDENGINISGVPGRKILLLIDNSQNQDDLIDVTEEFVYDTGSYTTGKLTWQLNDLSEGQHSIQLFAYDNFGNWATGETNFVSHKSGEIIISEMLPYPNPMEKNGKFTFVITEPADITLNIYTITGKKIRAIKENNCDRNYNEIIWDGKDQDGDYLTNNTYFYKIKAKSLLSNKTTEKKGKFIIYH